MAEKPSVIDSKWSQMQTTLVSETTIEEIGEQGPPTYGIATSADEPVSPHVL